MKLPAATLLLTLSTTTLATEPLTLEGKQGYERRTTIAEMADSVWQNQRFTVDHGLELLQGLSGSNRYYATRTLLGENRYHRNLLPNRMTATEMGQLLQGLGSQREEILQLMADQGIPAAYLSVKEIGQLIGSLTPRDYDQPLRILLGENRLDRNYSLPEFTPEQAARLLSNSDDRAGMIRYLADHTLLATTLTVEDAELIMQRQSAMDRHDSVKALLGANHKKQGYIQLPLSFQNTQQLLEGTALKSEMVRYFANYGVYRAGLSADEAYQLLQGIRHTDRYNSLQALLGENSLQQNYLQTPLSVTETSALLEEIAFRGEMVEWMSNHGLLDNNLSTEQANHLLAGVTQLDRHNALLSLLGGNERQQPYLTLPITGADAARLLEQSAYRGELVRWMSELQQLQPGMSGREAIQLLEGVIGENRFDAMAALLGVNRHQQRYIEGPLDSNTLEQLFKRSANRLQLIHHALDQGVIQLPLNLDQQVQILGRLYGSEREEAMALLQGQQ